MNGNRYPNEALPRKNVSLRGWITAGIALAAFGAGSLVSAQIARSNRSSQDDRLFDLRIYHAVPGKVPALAERFDDATTLFAKHHLDVVGYWVADDPAWKDTFVYLVAHRNRDEAKKNWDAFHADPAFQKYRDAEKAEKLIEKDDHIYMRPTAYSEMR
ncbi:MAG TPA: NIPSNAP family protein [Thermoanaerobaculia bacterium]